MVNLEEKQPSKDLLQPVTTVDPRDVNTPDAHVLRDPSMLRLTGKHPFNAGKCRMYFSYLFLSFT